MDEEYDVVILGTGPKECILGGLLEVEAKMKVLHLERSSSYGGNTVGLSLDKLYEHFGRDGKVPEELGRSRDWHVDLIPKFLMPNGQLLKLLIQTGVTPYLEFNSVEGSYVYKSGKIYKVPDNEKEILASSLVDIFERRRLRKFFSFVYEFDEEDPETWKHLDIETATSNDLYRQFALSVATIDVVGHALALYRDDSYLQNNMKDLVKRIKLYTDSLAKYGKSPYLYPLYGLGELPQSFLRLSANHGGTYMLDKAGAKIVYDDNGKVTGVEASGQMAKCKKVVCDPSYAKGRCKKVGQVVRAICILNHSVPNTNDALSTQIIIPQNQVGRHSDIYVCCVSYSHNVASHGFFLALVSTTVETTNPEEELKPGLDLLGPIKEKFVKVSDLYEPTDDGEKSQVFITKSDDATTHFSTTCDDVLDCFKRITGDEIDFSKIKISE